MLWSNSCCFIFTAALMALGTGGANPPAATAEVVLAERRSEWVKGIKTGQETNNSYGRLVALCLCSPDFRAVQILDLLGSPKQSVGKHLLMRRRCKTRLRLASGLCPQIVL